ncbi:MAG: hypothetical protein VX554_01080, partial [Candidatus Thermoplasmatota archaeon]|nr:hypothetical protein [Candidatus Thermoplasmatota archaeon]
MSGPVYAFRVEDYVSFSGCGKAELVAVVYDFGEERRGRRFACSVLGQDGSFWYYDAGVAPRRLMSDISMTHTLSVAWLLYAPTAEAVGVASTVGQVMTVVPTGLTQEAAGRGDDVVAVSAIAPTLTSTVAEGVQGQAVRAPTRDGAVESVTEVCSAASAPPVAGGVSGNKRSVDGPADSLIDTQLWNTLVSVYGVPCDVAEAVLAEMLKRFGMQRAVRLARG